MLAYNSGLSVVPVHLEGTNHVMPSDSLSVRPGKVKMTMGQPISSTDFPDIQSFMEHTRTTMLSLSGAA